MSSLKKIILKTEGKFIPDQTMKFLKQGYAIDQSQYTNIVKEKIQHVNQMKGQFITALLSKFKTDVKGLSSLVPSSAFITEMFMFGLKTGEYGDPGLNFWGDFRKEERVTIETPIRYRGYFKRVRQIFHVFEWRKNKINNFISIYRQGTHKDTMIPSLARPFFQLYNESMTHELQKHALSLELIESFLVNAPEEISRKKLTRVTVVTKS